MVSAADVGELRQLLPAAKLTARRRSVSAKRPQATAQPPALRVCKWPRDARLRTALQVWQPITFRRGCRAAAAPALLHARLQQGPLGGLLQARL